MTVKRAHHQGLQAQLFAFLLPSAVLCLLHFSAFGSQNDFDMTIKRAHRQGLQAQLDSWNTAWG